MTSRLWVVMLASLSLIGLAGCSSAAPTPEITAPPEPTSTPVPASADVLTPASLPLAGTILYYSERDGNAEIYIMYADGSDERRLTNNAVDDYSPTWSPDGAQIVFESDRDDPNPVACFPDCNYNLYVMNADGSDQRRLTDTPAAEVHPIWTPDGAQIAFDADYDGDGKSSIYIMNADGSDLRPLIEDDADNRFADWSPDGAQIAYTSSPQPLTGYAPLSGLYEIWVADADGSNRRQLTDNDVDDLFPAWSPDGAQIAFFAVLWPSQKQDIVVMNADGTGARKLTDTPGTVEEDPHWSPDGTMIVFQTDRDRNFEIYVMNADGTDLRRLTHNSSGEYWPSWRP